MAPVMDWLRGRNDVRLLGPSDTARRAPTISLVHARPGEDLAAALALHDINAGGGDFYAVRPLEAMGVDPVKGVLRVSFTHYTSEGEVERLISALEHIL